MRVIIRPEAERDIAEIYDWYESAAPGLGQSFTTSLEAGLGLIERFPEVARVVHLEYRRLLIRRFPYGIFYIARPAFISVAALLHLHRDPTWIQDQLARRRDGRPTA